MFQCALNTVPQCAYPEPQWALPLIWKYNPGFLLLVMLLKERLESPGAKNEKIKVYTLRINL